MPKSAVCKDKAKKSMLQQWAEGKRNHPQAWTVKELTLLGTDKDQEVSNQTGRTLVAVAVKRRQLKIKPYKATK